MMCIWQHDKRTDDYKIILNCVRKLMKNKSKIRSGKAQTFLNVQSKEYDNLMVTLEGLDRKKFT